MKAHSAFVFRYRRAIDPSQIASASITWIPSSFKDQVARNSSSHSSPSSKAASAAWIAKVFGSATSSVLIPLSTCFLISGFGMTIAAVCSPAMLKVFV
jgi:hypothetical protein